jgi:hypothetical protein
MHAPRCRICGVRHWLSEPCRFAGTEPVATGIPKTPVAAVDQPRPRVRRKAKRGTFDRTAYQRDYMRKWRAKRHKVTA